MNYNHLNKVYTYWRKNILPHLAHTFITSSFDDYLKRFSFLPSGKWIKDVENFKIHRIGFAIDPEEFAKKYKDCCVTYNTPIKPEDGIQRIIYQISPTLHVEMSLWVWIEHDNLYSYGSLFACYGDDTEFKHFVDDLFEKMSRTGNTEDKSNLGFLSGLGNQDVTDPK